MGGIYFWWGGNKNLVWGESTGVGFFQGGMNKFLAGGGGGLPPIPLSRENTAFLRNIHHNYVRDFWYTYVK